MADSAKLRWRVEPAPMSMTDIAANQCLTEWPRKRLGCLRSPRLWSAAFRVVRALLPSQDVQARICTRRQQTRVVD